MFIKELLELHEQTTLDALLEDMGNLKKIDKNLISAFLTQQYKGDRKGTTTAFRKHVGQNSELNVHILKTAKQAKEALVDDKDIVGIVLSIGDVQFAAFSQPTSGGFRSSGEPSKLVVNGDAMVKIIGDEDEVIKIGSEIEKKNGGLYAHFYKPDLKKNWKFDVPIGKIYGIMNTLVKAVKGKSDADLVFYSITKDVKAADKASERVEARRGVIPLPRDEKEYKKFVQKARNDISHRLDKFKSSKAESFDNFGALLAFVIKEGYIDKFKFGGQTYDLKDDRINLRTLQGKDSWNKEAYVEYRINSSTPEYKEYDKKNWDMYQALKDIKDEKVKKDFEDQMRAAKPFSELKVILKFEGGKIVPDRIEPVKGTLY